MGLTFSEVLIHLKLGKKVYRERWTDYLRLKINITTDSNSQKLPFIYLINNNLPDFVVPWHPNSIDILAEDWCIQGIE